MAKNFMGNEMENVMKTFKPGELVLLAGCPGSEMTVLAAEMAEYLVNKEKQDVIFFSLQHEKQDLAGKYFTNSGQEKVVIDDTAAISITEVRNRCVQLFRERKIKWIFIDCLPLVSGSKCCDTRVGELQEIVRELRILAMESGCVILATAPLSKYPVHYSRPTIRALRDYGLELDKEVNQVVLIWNENGEKEISIVNSQSGEMILYRWDDTWRSVEV